MKKSYVKPQVYFENFQLSASIATGCGRPLGHQLEACNDNVLIPPGVGLFGGDYTCEDTPVDGGTYGCYHVPTDSERLFTS